MRLPRRVPWASLSELEQVCSWIYTDEYDIEAKILAINRLSAWRAITYLPHALESTLSIITVIIQDHFQSLPSFTLSLRQSYSAAIIRLVNGLVDPLQLGAYARSIASIAHQLGLPPWIVELRHAATHEDLPSIDLLRDAARESMSWILHNYFIPTLNPSTTPQSQITLRSLEPVLKEHKRLMKLTTRDASLKTQYKGALLSLIKDVERWIAEARVAANVETRELGWETNVELLTDSSQADYKERCALERLCNALLERGCLIPLSKKKRDFPLDTFFPPKFSVQLWAPLLQHLQIIHPDFYPILSGRIVSILLRESERSDNPEARTHDPSYDMCLARWAKWSIEAWSNDEPTTGYDLRKEVIIMLMQSLGRGWTSPNVDRKAAIALLESLCVDVQELGTALVTLKSLSSDIHPNSWSSDDMAAMDQRLEILLSSELVDASTSRPPSPSEDAQLPSEDVSGWQLLRENSAWQPCPIGVHFGTG